MDEDGLRLHRQLVAVARFQDTLPNGQGGAVGGRKVMAHCSWLMGGGRRSDVGGQEWTDVGGQEWTDVGGEKYLGMIG